MQIEGITPLKGGKYTITFDEAESIVLYGKECGMYHLKEGEELKEEVYTQILSEVLEKRATKRAMHLLEKMDQTESQLRTKLKKNGYPECVIDTAISYVEKYHYIDDERYAKNYVQYYMTSRSMQRIKTDLYKKGIAKALMEQAIADVLAENDEWSEEEQILKWLKKKHYDEENSTTEEKRKIYQFLLRKGYKSTDIMQVMKVY